MDEYQSMNLDELEEASRKVYSHLIPIEADTFPNFIKILSLVGDDEDLSEVDE
jgi:hypothetical protein